MATLVLSAVGTAIGGPLLGSLGALAGGYIDRALFGTTMKQEGPRLSDLRFQASTAGATMPRVWGKHRVGTQVIWATNFKEKKKTESSGGKGSGGGGSAEVTTYSYSVSFAVALCEGPIDGIGRLWLDGRERRLSKYNARLYLGTETQGRDPKILAVEGADATPAFRGTAYLVFEDLKLEKFGNRVPQVTVEVIRRPPSSELALEEMAQAVTLIPGATEFGYATTPVSRVSGYFETTTENAHSDGDATDIEVALDRLADEAPNVAHVSLVVGWHGTDLRCGVCQIRPKVESADRKTSPFSWRVGPVTRSAAQIVSTYDGRPAIGGAPSDRSVYEAIRELKARGLAVTLYPFILMDIASGNALTDPWTGAAGQPAYPWRGRITCHPAPGVAGTVDKTAAAATQVASFFGVCTPAQFGWSSSDKAVTYSGPAGEWSYRRQVLHLARIAAAAGGVDAFLLGSEMVSLTIVRSATGVYPAVTALKALAADVRTILGAGAAISYAADWSEYHSHRPADGSGDVAFHLDPLWADANVDFVGIDNYLPVSDWREGSAHLDALAGATSIYDRAYLQAGIESGEYFDWFYASDADRAAQTRTAITDGAAGKPWVFRNKDIRAWWANAHKNRPGGVESASATAWTPQGKPIVFTELGSPAVDKGSNQPNVFVDAKSSESALPHFSDGRRDDALARAHLEAVLAYWRPAAGHNPVSTVDGQRMVKRIHLWTWDARPYPAFPQLADVWADAPNWRLGHWLDGRLGQARLRDVVADIAGAGNPGAVDASGLRDVVWGYMVDRLASPRDLLAPLMSAYFFDGRESDGVIRFRHCGAASAATIARADLARADSAEAAGGDLALTRGQESELPRALELHYFAADADYRQAVATSRRLVGATGAVSSLDIGLSLPDSRAGAIADALLIQAHVERERAAFALPPSALARDPGDVVTIAAGGREVRLRLEEVGGGAVRTVAALREEARVYDLDDGAEVNRSIARPRAGGLATIRYLDLPLLADADAPRAHAPKLAAYGAPWSPVAVYRAAAEGAATKLDTLLDDPATIGALALPLQRGPIGRWDFGSVLTVEVGADVALASAEPAAVLDRGNVAAVQTPSGRWEILQWRDAALVAPRTFALTALLRGQLGSDADMADLVPAGAAFVVLDAAVRVAALPLALARTPQWWLAGPADQPTSHPLYSGATLAFEAIGLRPLSPVHLRARRDPGTGDIAFSWVRRTRIGGDAFDAVEAPLGEESERYELDVLSGSTVLRTFKVTSPAAAYAAAAQTADFGAAPTAVTVQVAQMSVVYGRGALRKETLSV